MITNILLWIIFGGLAGWLASLFVGVDSSFGLWGNVVIGIVGAVIGGWIADMTGIKPGKPGTDQPTTFFSFLWAVVGAVILLVLLNLFF